MTSKHAKIFLLRPKLALFCVKCWIFNLIWIFFVRFVIKQCYYLKKDAHIKKEKLKYKQEGFDIYKKRCAELEGTNIPLSNSIVSKNNEVKIRDYRRNAFLNQLVANYINPKESRMPSLVFDFRFVNDITSPIPLKSIERQFSHLIGNNMKISDPFHLHFYNFKQHSKLYSRFEPNLFESNFVSVHEHSYMDDFRRNDLVYLSRDAGMYMLEYDPSKTYIIRSTIEDGKKETRHASSTQAKKDGIACMRLPLEQYVKYTNALLLLCCMLTEKSTIT